MSHLLRTGSPGDIREDTVVGEAFEVGNRTVYPVVRVKTIEGEVGSFFGAWICPLAMVVVEPTREYVVALTDEKFSSDRLLEMVVSSKGKGRGKRK